MDISVEIANTGPRAGDEVAQLYVGYERAQVDRPVKDLKGFARLHLDPGQTKRVEFALPIERLAYYDVAQARWIVEPIAYRVYVGPSSRTDDLLTARFRVCG